MEGTDMIKKEKPKYSNEYANYLRKIKRSKYLILTIQITILIAIFALWEILAITGAIDTFIMSSPSRVLKQIVLLFRSISYFNSCLQSN